MNAIHRIGNILVHLSIGLLLLSGCRTETPPPLVVEAVVAPDLSEPPPVEVRTTMWVLAAEIRHLEELMTNPSERERESMQAAVAGALERMRIAASTLDDAEPADRHPYFDQNLRQFVDRIERAQRALDRDPPNYFPASAIAGSCFICHGEQRAGMAMRRDASLGRKS